jgi:hypothetical protein
LEPTLDLVDDLVGRNHDRHLRRRRRRCWLLLRWVAVRDELDDHQQRHDVREDAHVVLSEHLEQSPQPCVPQPSLDLVGREILLLGLLGNFDQQAQLVVRRRRGDQFLDDLGESRTGWREKPGALPVAMVVMPNSSSYRR